MNGEPWLEQHDRIKDLFIDHGARKVALEDGDGCLIIYIDYKDDIYVAFLRYDPNIPVYYIKVVNGKYIHTYSCASSEYIPNGLYVFAKDLSELIPKTIQKIKALKNIEAKASGGS